MANRRNLTKNKNKNKSCKNRRNKNKGSRRMRGGMAPVMPPMMKEGMGAMMPPTMKGGMAPVGDTSMALGQKDSLAQGNQFLEIHKNQHGGMSPYPGGVTGSVLSDSSMVAAARTGPLDSALSQIQGMQDGGARRAKRSKTRGRKHKRGHSRRHRMRGGAHHFTGSPLSENSMLLPSGLEKSAGLNYDWDAARNPNYWAPKP